MSSANYTFGPNSVISSEIEFTPRKGGEDLVSVILRLDEKEPFSPDFLKTMGRSLTLNVNGKEIKHNQGDQIGDNPLSFPFDVRIARDAKKPLSIQLKLKGQEIGSWYVYEDGLVDVVKAPVISALTLRQLDQAAPPVDSMSLPAAGADNLYKEFAGALSNGQMAELAPNAKGVMLPLDRTVSDVEISKVIAAREQVFRRPDMFKDALWEIAKQAKQNHLKSIHLTTALVWEPEILAAIHEVAPQLGIQVSFSPAIDKSPEDPARKSDYIKTRLPELLKSEYINGLSLNGPDVYHAGGLEPHIQAYCQAIETSKKPVTLAINAGERNFHAANIDTLTDIISRTEGNAPLNIRIVGGLFGVNPDKMARLQKALQKKEGSLQFLIDPAYYLTVGESPAAINMAINKLSDAGIAVTYCSKAPGMIGYTWGECSQLDKSSLEKFTKPASPVLIQDSDFVPGEVRFEDKSAHYVQQEQERLDAIAKKLDSYMRDDNNEPIRRGFPQKEDGTFKKPVLIMAGSVSNGINPDPRTAEEKATVKKMRADIRVMLETLDPAECAVYTGSTASGFEALVQQEVAAWNKVHPDRKFDICGLVAEAALTDENKAYLTRSFTHMEYVGKNWDDQLSALNSTSNNPADITLITVGGGGIVRQAIDVAKSQGIRTLLWAGPSPDQGEYAKLWQQVYDAAIVSPLLDALNVKRKEDITPDLKGPAGGYVTPGLSEFQRYLSGFMKENPKLSNELDLDLIVEKLNAAITASMNDDKGKVAKTIKAISDHQHGYLRALGGASALKLEQYPELQDYAFGDGLQLSTLLQQNAPDIVRKDMDKEAVRTQYIAEWRDAQALTDTSEWRKNSEIKNDFTDDNATMWIVYNKLLPALMAEDRRLFDDIHRADKGKKPTYSYGHYFNFANYQEAWSDEVRINPENGPMGLGLIYNTREQAEHANRFIKSLLHSQGFQIDSPQEAEDGKFVLNTNMQPSEYAYLVQMGEALFVAEHKQEASDYRRLLERQVASRYKKDLPESIQFMPSAGSFQLLLIRPEIAQHMQSLVHENLAEDRAPNWVESGLRLQRQTQNGVHVYGYSLQKSREIAAHGTHSPFNLATATDAEGLTAKAAVATVQQWRGKRAHADMPAASQVGGKIADAVIPLGWFQTAANSLARLAGRDTMPVIGVVKTATSAAIGAGVGKFSERVVQPAMNPMFAGSRVHKAVAEGTARGIDHDIERLQQLASDAGLGLDKRAATPTSQLGSMHETAVRSGSPQISRF